jgi:hypothetical protein
MVWRTGWCRVPRNVNRVLTFTAKKERQLFTCHAASEVTRKSATERVGVKEGLREISRNAEEYVERGCWIHRAKQAEQQPIHLIHLRFSDTGLASCMQLVGQAIPSRARPTAYFRIATGAPQPCVGGGLL